MITNMVFFQAKFIPSIMCTTPYFIRS